MGKSSTKTAHFDIFLAINKTTRLFIRSTKKSRQNDQNLVHFQKQKETSSNALIKLIIVCDLFALRLNGDLIDSNDARK